MRYDLVIFDLDGTLLDTVEDLRAALNYALERAGYAPKTKDEMRRIIGGGVYNHVVNALPKGTELTMVRTDNDSWVDMIYGEMQYVRVRIDEEKWPQTIGGKDIEDIFDNTVFAG